MTEQEWLDCSAIGPMLTFLERRKPTRKLRLFAVACCRRAWHLFTDLRSRRAIEVAELYADNLVSSREVEAAQHGAKEAVQEVMAEVKRQAGRYISVSQHDEIGLRNAAAECLKGSDFFGDPRIDDAHGSAFTAAAAVQYALVRAETGGAPDHENVEEFLHLVTDTMKFDCSVLHHIIGNPFRPYPAPASWPSTVVQLAESLYAGQDCAFALHDALLEAGHAELAEHFREEKSHAKGCWVVDLIRGKQ
jgi:hypothetical protein